MDPVHVIALTMGVAWASGINLYAAIVMLGFLGSTGHIVLPPDLEVLAHPAVMVAGGLMYCVEFFADKVPGVDTGWDALHTFVRIPAGAVLAAGAIGDVSAPAHLAAALVGGGIAAGTHFTKAGSRVLINTSPEPVTNWTASLVEDIAVFAGLWAALNHPWVFLGLFGVFVVLVIWLLPKLMRGVLAVARAAGRWLGMGSDPPATAAQSPVGDPVQAPVQAPGQQPIPLPDQSERPPP